MISLNCPITQNVLRYEIVNEDIWFHLSDVCEALSLTNSRDVAARLEDESKQKFENDYQTGMSPWFVDEEAFYTIALGCRDARKPGTVAYKFRKWVIDVIKTIRKTGTYGTTPEQQQKTDEAFSELGLPDHVRQAQTHYLDLMLQTDCPNKSEKYAIALTAINNIFKPSIPPVDEKPENSYSEFLPIPDDAIAKLKTKILTTLRSYPGQTARELRQRLICRKSRYTAPMLTIALQQLIEAQKVIEQQKGKRIELFLNS
jgi:prophage antirepressor-like protein